VAVIEFQDANPVLFDLDGTLTDNSAGIIRSARVGLTAVGVDDVDDQQIRAEIGPPLRSMFTNLGVLESRLEDAVAGYRSYYVDRGVLENEVYEGVEAALVALWDDSRTLAVATSKPEIFACRILDHFGLSGYFKFVGGATLDAKRETKAEVVAHTLTSLGMAAGSAVMIGDRRHDIEGARAAGVERSVGVTWGFGARDELVDADATITIDSPAELPTLFS